MTTFQHRQLALAREAQLTAVKHPAGSLMRVLLESAAKAHARAADFTTAKAYKESTR